MFEPIAYCVVELATIEIERGTAFLRHNGEPERQRRVCHIGAADVECPGDRVRVGYHESVRAALGELRLDALKLRRRTLAGEALVMQRDRPERRRGPIVPDCIERIGLRGHEVCADGRARLGKFLGGFDGVQPRIVAKLLPGSEVCLDPGLRRPIDQVIDCEDRGVGLLPHLQAVAAVDEQHRPVGEHDRDAGRTREAGEPSEPFFGWWDVLILMPIRARDDEAVEAATTELGT